ncbi:MAG TPA: 3-oxoacyl-[acyl-carrier-protein] synthase III C-terminal domain-containing protein [Candidatus Binataceae bacterium]
MRLAPLKLDRNEMSPAVIGVGTALPRNYANQEQLTAALRDLWSTRYSDLRRFDQIHDALGISGRHLAVPMDEYYALDTFAKSNDAWIRVAPELGIAAVQNALADARVKPDEIDHFFFVTVTGIATPSVDTRIISALGMRPNIKRTPVFGLGCVAGAAGMSRAADYVRAFPRDTALLLSIELCSLTLQRNDFSVANMIASGLFGDGAAALVIGNTARAKPEHPQIIATRSILYPETENILGWELVEGGFKIVLSSRLTELVGRNIRGEVDSFLKENGVERSNIRHWIAHAGGPKVLRVLEESLELAEGALIRSWQSLKSLGNLSSASVLFILEDLVTEAPPARGDYGLVIAMGPGFSVELILLRW